MEEYR